MTTLIVLILTDYWTSGVYLQKSWDTNVVTLSRLWLLFFLVFSDSVWRAKSAFSLCLIVSFQFLFFFFFVVVLFINFLTCTESDVNTSGERPPCLWMTHSYSHAPTLVFGCVFVCTYFNRLPVVVGVVLLCIQKPLCAHVVKAGLRTQPNRRFLCKLLHWLKFLHIFQYLFDASPLHLYLVSLEMFQSHFNHVYC